jgi:hypothetical protein
MSAMILLHSNHQTSRNKKLQRWVENKAPLTQKLQSPSYVVQNRECLVWYLVRPGGILRRRTRMVSLRTTRWDRNFCPVRDRRSWRQRKDETSPGQSARILLVNTNKDSTSALPFHIEVAVDCNVSKSNCRRFPHTSFSSQRASFLFSDS